MTDSSCFVFDFGSGRTKAGSAGTETPTVQLNTCYRQMPAQAGQTGKVIYGRAAEDITDRKTKLSRPVVGSQIHWDKMEAFAQHIKEDLGSPEDFTALVAFDGSKEDRRKMTEIFFKLGANELCFYPPETLALYSTGRTNGLVVDCGHKQTKVVPIFEGQRIIYGRIVNDVGGADIDAALKKSINMKIRAQDITKIKHKLCRFNPRSENAGEMLPETEVKEQTYELPNGDIITIQPESMLVPEKILFQGENTLHEMANESLGRLDGDLQSQLLGNIYLQGGTSMIKGIADVFTDYWKRQFKQPLLSAPVTDSQRFIGTWIGGSILGSMPTFKDLVIKKEEFEESGRLPRQF